MGWAIDLDGVMWLGDEPIDGSAEAVQQLREQGEPVLFVTNNSSVPAADVAARLTAMGIDATGSVVTSADAAATLVTAGERVLVCAGPGVVAALADRGAEAVSDREADSSERVDAVIVGFTRTFDFEMLAAATKAVRAGARLIGTNDDATYPTPEGQLPGGGAILAAVATASGVVPVVAGKPHRPLVDIVRARLGAEGTMVGDRPDTDGKFARALDYRFGLVWSGVTDAESVVDPRPDLAAPDLALLVRLATDRDLERPAL